MIVSVGMLILIGFLLGGFAQRLVDVGQVSKLACLGRIWGGLIENNGFYGFSSHLGKCCFKGSFRPRRPSGGPPGGSPGGAPPAPVASPQRNKVLIGAGSLSAGAGTTALPSLTQYIYCFLELNMPCDCSREMESRGILFIGIGAYFLY